MQHRIGEGDQAYTRGELRPQRSSGVTARPDCPAGRADLLAQFAGTALGLSVVELVDQLAAQMVAQASLAARAGADLDQVARWIPVGVKRGEDIQASRCR